MFQIHAPYISKRRDINKKVFENIILFNILLVGKTTLRKSLSQVAEPNIVLLYVSAICLNFDLLLVVLKYIYSVGFQNISIWLVLL